MSVYLIAAVERHDLETYAKYEAGGLERLAQFDIEALSVDDDPQLLEGALPGKRIVLVKFKDQAAVLRWYNSKEYQGVRPFRLQAASTAFLMTVKGLD